MVDSKLPPNRIFTSDHLRNPKAEEDLEHAAARAKEIKKEELGRVREILIQGMAEGRNPLHVALEIAGKVDPDTGQRIGGIINLSNHDLNTLETVRQYLQQLDKRYLALKLRDRRFDRTIRAALKKNAPLAQEKVVRIIISYQNRLLQRRAEIIARTEMLQSINRTEYTTNLQLIKDGRINAAAITKEWDDCGDAKVRSSHAVLAKKYGKGKGIPLEEPFVFPSGIKMLYPGDQSLGAPAKEVIQCRCRIYCRVDWLYGVE